MGLIEAWLAEIAHIKSSLDPRTPDVECMARISDLKLRIAHQIARTTKRKELIDSYYNTECALSYAPLSPSTSSDGSPLEKSNS
jgi:hypothetical protein